MLGLVIRKTLFKVSAVVPGSGIKIEKEAEIWMGGQNLAQTETQTDGRFDKVRPRPEYIKPKGHKQFKMCLKLFEGISYYQTQQSLIVLYKNNLTKCANS